MQQHSSDCIVGRFQHTVVQSADLKHECIAGRLFTCPAAFSVLCRCVVDTRYVLQVRCWAGSFISSTVNSSMLEVQLRNCSCSWQQPCCQLHAVCSQHESCSSRLVQRAAPQHWTASCMITLPTTAACSQNQQCTSLTAASASLCCPILLPAAAS